MDIRRAIQVVKFGWKHAGTISSETEESRIWLFYDILSCYRKFHLWSNQYLKERFYSLKREERERIGKGYKEKNDKYEEIKRDKLENRIFLNKWKSYYWELGYEERRKKRQEAYAKRYNMGRNCNISFDVHIERNHNLNGTIKIGNNVLLSKHCYIDYSGKLEIQDDVGISNGVIIETHEHISYTNPSASTERIKQTRMIIHQGVIIGSRAIIHASVKDIGRFSRIGAGAVVRYNVPPYAIVMGNPAKIVAFSMTPDQVAEFEKEKYPEEDRISIEQYEKNYNKYFINRIDEINQFIKK